MTITNEEMKQNAQGQWEVTRTEVVTVDTEVIIAEKEAQLLEMYKELEALKSSK